MSVEKVLKKSKIYELGIAQMFLSRNINDFHQEALSHYGLTPIQWFVLSVIADATDKGGIRVTDLASIFSVKTTYITSILNSLRAKAYVETRYDANDARVRLAIVTKKGAKESVLVGDYVQKEAGRLLEGIVSEDDFEKYLRVVKKLGQIH